MDDVGKFQRGESLNAETDTKQAPLPPVEEAPSRQRQENYMESAKRNDKLQERRTQQQGGGKKPAAVTKKPALSAAAVTKKPAPPTRPTNNTNNNDATKNPPPAVVKPPASARKEKNNEEPAKPPPKSHPQKGKPLHVCGCFGTVHKPLTNCLYCGRISCHKEGFDFCAFCGLLVEKVDATPPKEGTENKAWLHKERLLRFDREFARRTVVLDDQEDYYANTTSTWLTEDEKQTAQENEGNREKDLHQRKKQTLNLQF